MVSGHRSWGQQKLNTENLRKERIKVSWVDSPWAKRYSALKCGFLREQAAINQTAHPFSVTVCVAFSLLYVDLALNPWGGLWCI